MFTTWTPSSISCLAGSAVSYWLAVKSFENDNLLTVAFMFVIAITMTFLASACELAKK